MSIRVHIGKRSKRKIHSVPLLLIGNMPGIFGHFYHYNIKKL